MERAPADVYSEHRRRRELVYQVDSERRTVFRPRVRAGDTWQVSAGRGTVYAVTVVRPRGEREAYNIVLVDLDEGFRMMSTVLGGTPAIGDRVRLAWREDDDGPVPVFEVDA